MEKATAKILQTGSVMGSVVPRAGLSMSATYKGDGDEDWWSV